MQNAAHFTMKQIHILMVEDNEGDILLTKEALEDGKVANRVSVVTDGWEAIEFLEQRGKYKDEHLPDLILLDINLPKMNGHEVLNHVKSSDQLRHIPVVMLTTSSSPNDIYKSYQHYVNCYVTKPVDVNKFLEVVAGIEDFWISIVQLPQPLHPKR